MERANASLRPGLPNLNRKETALDLCAELLTEALTQENTACC